MEKHQRKILLVDDSKAYHSIFQVAFDNADYQLFICNSGKDALDLIEHEYIDFICSSFYLKDMEGSELCRQVRPLTQFAYKPFVLLTSVESQDALKQTLPAGVTDIFHKKDVEQLLAYIRRFPFWDGKIQGRILYVEDTRSQRELVKVMLEKHGLTVDAFASADEAWSHFVQKEYDVVLTDIVLEGMMSGLSFVNQIRRQPGTKGDTPILAVTAFDDKTRRIELFNLGVTDYIIKPVVNEELFVRVSSLITKNELMTEVRHERDRADQANLVKSEFLSMMGHELRTPLNAILGFSQLAEIDLQDDTPTASILEHLAEIRKSGEHLLTLITDLFDISQIEAGRMNINLSGVDIPPIIDSCIQKVRFLADPRKISVKLLPDPQHVEQGGETVAMADEVRLTQVLVNLLSNAIKYNQDQGSVFVDWHTTPSGHCRIGVTDTGPGISADMQSLIFQPYTRISPDKDKIEGRGIGLALTKKLVELMGGQIGFTSQTGKGSTFWVALPTPGSTPPVADAK